MRSEGPSQTALQVAAARAAHLQFDPAPHLLDDPLALALLGPEHETMLDGYRDEGSWMLLENRVSIPLRARFVEDQLGEAYQRGVRQFVVLGAGLDSFVFRQPERMAGLRVYEVDHPNMQAWKRERLSALGWTEPENARFVACDFESMATSEALQTTDFDASAPAVVSWMGVTYYLEKDTVKSTLEDLAGILERGSEIVLDVMRPWDELPKRYAEFRKILAEYLKHAAEPHISRYADAEILDTIRRAGYSKTHIDSHKTLEARYRAKTGTRKPFSERFRIVRALT